MERIPQEMSKDIAEIALSMNSGTSAEMLAALHKAWKAGYSEGFRIGVESGQKHMAEVMDMTFRSMS